ncbi:Trehalose synthase [uncultured archaeon]|nr:Trehalose synthase [uncultured archaeon]
MLTTYHHDPVEPEHNVKIFRTIPNLLESYVPNNAAYKALRYLILPAMTFLSIFFIHLRYRPKLIHVHSSTSITSGVCLFSLLFRIPVFVDVQDLFPGQFPLKRVIKTGCMPRYIALGKKVEEMLVSINIPNKKILTLPLARLPIERKIMETSKRKMNDTEVNILFIGELTKIKGIDILLESFKIASNQSMNLFLKIIGEGPMHAYCKEFICNNNLNIKLLGRLNHDKAMEEISFSDIIVLPSRTESFGRVILEAFEFEKPVIATDVGGIPELLKNGENGVLVNPCDPTGLADAMLKLSKDNILRDKMGKNGKQSLKGMLSFKDITKKIIEFYGL